MLRKQQQKKSNKRDSGSSGYSHLGHLLLGLLHLVHAASKLRLGLGLALLGQRDLCMLPRLEGLDPLMENILWGRQGIVTTVVLRVKCVK